MGAHVFLALSPCTSVSACFALTLTLHCTMLAMPHQNQTKLPPTNSHSSSYYYSIIQSCNQPFRSPPTHTLQSLSETTYEAREELRKAISVLFSFQLLQAVQWTRLNSRPYMSIEPVDPDGWPVGRYNGPACRDSISPAHRRASLKQSIQLSALTFLDIIIIEVVTAPPRWLTWPIAIYSLLFQMRPSNVYHTLMD